MRSVSHFASSKERARQLSTEHGPMVLVRMKVVVPTAWQRDFDGDLAPCEHVSVVRYGTVLLRDWNKVQALEKGRKAALLSVIRCDRPLRGDVRYDFLARGEYSEADQFVNGDRRYQTTETEDGFHVLDRLTGCEDSFGFIGGAA